MYAQLLTRAYDTIKSEDPLAVVLGCSTAGIDKDFIRKTMDLGGKFDALTIHPYQAELNEAAYISQLQEVRQLAGGRTVWITEIGFPTQLFTGRDERTQASLVARTYLASIASGAVANTCWYDFRNDGDDPFYNEENFGLIRADFRLKPAYRAMATLGRTLAGLKMRGQIDVGPDAYALRFGDGKRDAVAVWSPNVSRLLTFDTSSDVQVADAMGSLVRPARVGNRVTITLDAGFPVYITGQAGFAFEPAGCLLPVHVSKTHLHPGDETVIRPDAGVQVLEWQLPGGWASPQRAADGTYVIIVPRDAAPGMIEVQVMVQYGGAVRVPLELVIEPRCLRL